MSLREAFMKRENRSRWFLDIYIMAMAMTWLLKYLDPKRRSNNGLLGSTVLHHIVLAHVEVHVSET